MTVRKILERISVVLILLGLLFMVQPWSLQLYNLSFVFLGIGGGMWITLGYIPSNPKVSQIVKVVMGVILISLLFIVVSIVIVPYLIRLL